MSNIQRPIASICRRCRRSGPLRRRSLVVALSTAAAVTLASCGSATTSKPTANGSTGSSSAPATKITLTYLSHWNTAPGTTIDNSVIKQFEKAHPGVTVKQIEVQSGTTYAKFETMAASGEYPSVYDMGNTYAGSLIPTGVVSQVDYKAAGYSSKSALLNAYLPGVFGAYQYQGKTYGIPEEVSNYATWALPGDFKAAGVPVPTTWNQVCADGPKLLKTVGGKVVQEEVALPTNLAAAQAIFFDAVSREFGSPDFNLVGTKSYLDSAPVIAAATMLQNLVYKCHAAVPSLNSSQQGADRYVYWEGKAAMMLTAGTWNAGSPSTYPKVKSQKAYPYPAGPNGTADDLYGYAFVVPKKASHQVLSWELAAALAGDGTTWLQKEGLFRGSKASSSAAAKIIPEWNTVWEPLYSKGVYIENLDKGSQIDSIIGSALDSILLSHANVKSTLASANAEIQPLLNK